MITIRVIDTVTGRRGEQTVNNLALSVALLTSLFARPEFDPWAELYPPGGIDVDRVVELAGLPPSIAALFREAKASQQRAELSVATDLLANGDAVITIRRGPPVQDAKPGPHPDHVS